MTRLLLLIGLATSLIAIVPTPAAAAPGRWALVIGNDTYSAVQSLRNAGADADLIGGELQRAGFSVVNTKNATRRAMLRAVLDLSRRAEGGGELVLYYAGHGVQVANTNYLLPVDFESTEPSLLSHESLSLSDILVTLQEAKPRFALVIVDACRDNPLAGKKGRNLDIQKGLSPMQPATGQMIVFSAGNGQVALDSTGTDRDVNGLFAQELAKQIRRPGLDIRDMMVAIRSSVEARAAAVQHAQRPAIYDESSGQFAFYPQSIPAPARAEPARPQIPAGPSTGAHYRSAEEIEDELWRLLSESRSPEAYAAYLREYPSGRYAPSARVRQELFRSAAAKAAPSTGSEPAPAAGPTSSAAAPAAGPTSSPAAPAADPTFSPAATPAGSGIDRERPRPTPAAQPRPSTSDEIAIAPPTTSTTQSGSDLTARQLVGRRFAGRNGGFSLELAFEKGGARVHRFFGPTSITQVPGLVGATTGQGLAIRCGFTNWVYLSENKEFSARCNAEDGPRTGISISGFFPHLKIEQYGSRGADVLELQEVR